MALALAWVLTVCVANGGVLSRRPCYGLILATAVLADGRNCRGLFRGVRHHGDLSCTEHALVDREAAAHHSGHCARLCTGVGRLHDSLVHVGVELLGQGLLLLDAVLAEGVQEALLSQADALYDGLELSGGLVWSGGNGRIPLLQAVLSVLESILEVVGHRQQIPREPISGKLVCVLQVDGRTPPCVLHDGLVLGGQEALCSSHSNGHLSSHQQGNGSANQGNHPDAPDQSSLHSALHLGHTLPLMAHRCLQQCHVFPLMLQCDLQRLCMRSR
mmetsp:Transcript_92213/g.298556  ORF Transcript_92213/g.298556 Transcript_92213/m.298556 type:complete len:273 (-) Transcript_92213:105-923(-)